jgi:hypothetical protein
MNTQTPVPGSAMPAQSTPKILLAGAETEDIFALVVTLPPYDPSVPLHLDLHHTEGCFVLAGTMVVTHDHQTITLAQRAAVMGLQGGTLPFWDTS